MIKVNKGLPVLRLLSYYNKKACAEAYKDAQNDMLKNNWRCVESILGKDSQV